MTLAPQGPGALPSAPAGYAGTVITVDGDRATALVPAYSGDRPQGPAPYVAPAGAPSVGDPCTVVFTDAGPLVVVAGGGLDRAPYVSVEDFPLIVPEAEDAPRINRAIASLGARGGTVVFRAVDYIVNTGVAVPVNTPVRLLGAGMPMGGPNVGGTRLLRTAGTTTVVSCLGSGVTDSTRGRVEIEHMEVNGGALAGIGIDLQRVQNVWLHRLRVASCSHIGLHIREAYNSAAGVWYVHGCGNGSSQPAMVLDAVSSAQGASATFSFAHGEFEGNGGTDLQLTGDLTSGPTTDISFGYLKFEAGAAGALGCPYVDWAYVQNIKVGDCAITMHGSGASPRTVPPFQMGSFAGAGAACQISNLSIDSTQNADVTDLVQVVRGALQIAQLSAVGFASFLASRSLIRIEATVNQGAVKVGRVNSNSGVATFSDARSSPTATFSLNPRARVARNAAYNVPNAAWTKLPFDTAEYDYDTLFDAANNQLKCKSPGPYRLVANVHFDVSNLGNYRSAVIFVNAAAVVAIASGLPHAVAPARFSLSADVDLALNDTVEVRLYQDTGGVLALITAVNLGVGARNVNWLSAVRSP